LLYEGNSPGRKTTHSFIGCCPLIPAYFCIFVLYPDRENRQLNNQFLRMRLKLQLFFALVLIIQGAIVAQTNELYWKNRKPHAAYWQQDVYYKIDARIDESTHQLTAKQELKYTNNSPDTLRFVYFHLFQNAFVKGAYTH